MAKAKKQTTLVNLVSSAMTGIRRAMLVRRTAKPIQMVRYDAIAKRHVLFTEAKRRRAPRNITFGFGKKLE
ncbi:mitochondrial 54S ribosomal protein bL33m [Kockiozyma suomiensis]|uniref:mitochondrial 54S ribosomal protein bL33m n=1 Tax=Kockiozyma suomiensis TaxID=1337062 RepID=UPI003343E7AE